VVGPPRPISDHSIIISLLIHTFERHFLDTLRVYDLYDRTEMTCLPLWGK